MLEALRRNAWNVTRSAEETGMQRANFQALMKKHDIRIRDAGKNPAEPARPEAACYAWAPGSRRPPRLPRSR